MAKTLESEFNILFSALLKNTIAGVTDPIAAALKKDLRSGKMASGTTASTANEATYLPNRALTGGANETIDVKDWTGIDAGAGAAQDVLGLTILMVELVVLFIYNQPTSVGYLEVGPAAANGLFGAGFPWKTATDINAVQPGGVLCFYAPKDPAYGPVDATHKAIKIAAVGGAVTYDLGAIGRNA